MEQALITVAEAAKRIGVSRSMVDVWIWREEDPLPSVPYGKSGKFRKVIADQIQGWLAEESSRKARVTGSGRK